MVLVPGAATVRPAGAPRLVRYQRVSRKGSHFRIPREGCEGQRVPGAEDRRPAGRGPAKPLPGHCPAGRARDKPRAKSVMSQALASPSRAREAPMGESLLSSTKNDGPYWPRRATLGPVT